MPPRVPRARSAARSAALAAALRWGVSVLAVAALGLALDSAARRQAVLTPAPPALRLELVRLPAPAALPAALPAADANAAGATEAVAPSMTTSSSDTSVARSAALPPRRAPVAPRSAAAAASTDAPTAASVAHAALALAAAERELPAAERAAPATPEHHALVPPPGSNHPVRTQPTPTPRLVGARELDPGFALRQPVQPRYPPSAQRLGRPGTVRVELEVAADGSVTALEVRDDAPGWGFGAAAREAFAVAHFSPPTVNGQPVRVRWRKTLHFRP